VLNARLGSKAVENDCFPFAFDVSGACRFCALMLDRRKRTTMNNFNGLG
jgi:hypothetical protein